jgi:Tfp pilus assembly PilM family ATPase
MSDGISFFSNDDLDQHIKKVMSQTNYTEEEAKKKLSLFNCDYMKVIRDYMEIPEKKEERKVKSVNQEIFRQIRTKLDNSMKEYREKHPINMEQIVENFKESDERAKMRIKN